MCIFHSGVVIPIMMYRCDHRIINIYRGVVIGADKRPTWAERGVWVSLLIFESDSMHATRN